MEKAEKVEEKEYYEMSISSTNTNEKLTEISQKIDNMANRLVDVMRGILEELIKLNNKKVNNHEKK